MLESLCLCLWNHWSSAEFILDCMECNISILGSRIDASFFTIHKTSGNGCMRWYWPSKPITSYNILLVLPLLSKLGRMDWVIDPKLNSIECSMRVRDMPWLNWCGIVMDGLSNKDDFWESSVSQWVVIICSGQLLWSASIHMACLMSLIDNDSATNDHQTRKILNHQQY